MSQYISQKWLHATSYSTYLVVKVSGGEKLLLVELVDIAIDIAVKINSLRLIKLVTDIMTGLGGFACIARRYSSYRANWLLLRSIYE